MGSRIANALRIGAAASSLAAAGLLAAFRTGLVGARPALLAGLVGFAVPLAGAAFAVAAARVFRGPRRLAPGGELLLFLGLSTMATAGLWNWLFSIQGAVLLQEREPARLSRPEEVVSLDLGPLADRHDLELTVGLARLRLEPVGPGGFQPVSALKLLDVRGEEVGLTVAPGAPGLHRTLVFRQGAFGFSPRVVVARDGRTRFDAQVPFRTVVEGREGLAFHGSIGVPEEKLSLEGAVTLEDLNDEMKGHPRLELAVKRDEGAPVAVVLRPGELADLGDGLQVGFAGLRRWSEIDFSRRSYPAPILAGAAMFVLGALLWPLAAWRRW